MFVKQFMARWKKEHPAHTHPKFFIKPSVYNIMKIVFRFETGNDANIG